MDWLTWQFCIKLTNIESLFCDFNCNLIVTWHLDDKTFFITRSTKKPVIQFPRKNTTNTFLNYDAEEMIKCIHNQELRLSGPIYILQEIPNHQLSTVSRLYKTTFQLVVPKNRKQSYPNSEAHPHMGSHVWPDLQCEFQATLLAFSHTPSMGTNYFQSKSQLIYQACWFPMAVSN